MVNGRDGKTYRRPQPRPDLGFVVVDSHFIAQDLENHLGMIHAHLAMAQAHIEEIRHKFCDDVSVDELAASIEPIIRDIRNISGRAT